MYLSAARRASIALILLCLVALSVQAQQSEGGASSTDGKTPSALARGAHPLGSFGGADFDRINLFNGNLSFNIPLAALDGRAGMGVSVMLNYNSKIWRSQVMNEETGGEPIPHPTAVYVPWDNFAPELAPGWSIHVGRMVARQTYRRIDCEAGGFTFKAADTLTIFTFTAPDGTEYQFRDAAHGGRAQNPVYNVCELQSAPNRGTTFYATDGTAATFISSVEVLDYVGQDGGSSRVLPGHGDVYLRDGRRFHIVDGLVIWQQDTNGNRVNFEYDEGNRLTLVRDTLGRTIEIVYDPDTSTLAKIRVTRTNYQGTGTVIRETAIRKAKLHSANGHLLREDMTQPPGAPTYRELFPFFYSDPNDASGDVKFKPFLLSSIELPSGGGTPYRYDFLYNRHGEVARVETPSGGAIEFDATTEDEGGLGEIFRRVKERRTYSSREATDGTLATRTTYSNPFVPETETEAIVTERRYAHAGTKVLSDDTVFSSVRHKFYGSPRKKFEIEPSGMGTGYEPWLHGKEFRTVEYAGDPDQSGSQRRAMDYTWEQGPFEASSAWIQALDSTVQPQNNPRLTETITTLYENNAAVQSSRVKMGYDEYNNVTREEYYDYNAASNAKPLRQVDRSYIRVNSEVNGLNYHSRTQSPLIHIRSLVETETISHYNSAGQQVVEASTHFVYDDYDATGMSAAPLDRDFSAFASSRDSNYGYSGSTLVRQARGNLTSVTAGYGFGPSVEATTHTHYDIAGCVVRTFDPLATSTALQAPHSTKIEYSAATAFAYPVETWVWVPREGGAPLELETLTTYDFWTGQVLSVQGYNDEVTSFEYHDPLDRLTREDRPDIAGETSYDYGSMGSYPITVRATSSFDESTTVWNETRYDGLGRARFQARKDAGGTGSVTVETRYDDLGRVWLTSNPYRSPLVIDGWTRTSYDELNRPVLIEHVAAPADDDTSAGYTGRITTEYYGSQVTVTDQADRKRRSTTDALGRLTTVTEAPGVTNYDFATTYTYDARGNLRSVAQGVQRRYFQYDALGRLTRSRIPEQQPNSQLDDADAELANSQWTARYTYDAASNLKTRTDARNIVTNYAYDAINRIASKTYTNLTPATPTPNVKYYYDDAAVTEVNETGFDRGASLGRLVGVVTLAVSQTGQSPTAMLRGYDIAGRVVRSRQVLDGQNYDTTLSLNSGGAVETQTYPSNRIVEMGYNAAGQVASISYGPSESTQLFASGIAYEPSGALTEQRLGNQLYHGLTYNNRLQPVAIKLGTSSGAVDKLSLRYKYGVASSVETNASVNEERNNGNIGQIRIELGDAANTSFVQNYLYDELNRLSRAREYFNSGGGSVGLHTPNGLNAQSAGLEQINLTWSADLTTETAFEVWRKQTSQGESAWAPLGPTLGRVTHFEDGTVTTNVSYDYRVRAVEVSSDPNVPPVYSDFSNVATEVAGAPCSPPSAPSNVVHVSSTTSTITLGWVDTSSDENGFSVERKQSAHPEAVWTTVASLAANTTSFTDRNLTASSTYYYRIRATSTCGNSSYAPNANGLSAITLIDNDPPLQAPTSLRVGPVHRHQVNLTWIDNSTGAMPETGFRVLRRDVTLGGAWINLTAAADSPALPNGMLAADTIQFEDTDSAHALKPELDLVKGHTYEYRVTAVNINPETMVEKTAASKPISGRVPDPDDGPNAPTMPEAHRMTTSRIRVRWTYGTDPAVGFVIYRQSGTGIFMPVAVARPAARHFVDTALEPSTTYNYVVYALGNDNKLSPPSQASPNGYVSATTYGPTDVIAGSDSIGVYVTASGSWFLRNTQTAGAADFAFTYGPGGAGWLPFKGDWDGTGTDTPGIYNPTYGIFLTDVNGGGGASTIFSFGPSTGGWLPISGDWDGDGDDSVGIYDPATGTFFLKNTNTGGAADYVFTFGPGGAGFMPIAGDWDGNGDDTIGLYDPATSNFFLRNANTGGGADLVVQFGGGGGVPVAGDWDGDGQDTIGFYIPSSGTFLLRNANVVGAADVVVAFGPTNSTPLAGDWDGQLAKSAGKRKTIRRRKPAKELKTNVAVSDAEGPASKTQDPQLSWEQEFAYDRYGNRLASSISVDPESNRFDVNATGYGYDLDGNLTAEPGAEYKYDAENHMWSSQTTTTVTYFYDGEGQRVKTVSPQLTRRFIYDAAGSLIAEYEGSTLKKEYVYGVTGLLATVEDPGAQTPMVRYMTPDHLGTPRVLSDRDGNVSRHDYKPFGEELGVQDNRTSTFGYGVDDKVRQKFTSKERDVETGLDYFGARYFASEKGRFSSPDPLFIEMRRLHNPQELNLYVYVINNPTRHTDPTGLDFRFSGIDADKFVADLNKRQGAKFKVTRDVDGFLRVENQAKVKVNKLSDRERALFTAITDPNVHAVIEGVSQDAEIDFGAFGPAVSAPAGKNLIDSSDLALLRKASKTVAGEVIGHEMLEAYESAKTGSLDYKPNHEAASVHFPEPAFGNESSLPGEKGKPILTGYSAEWTWTGAKVRVRVSYEFVSPIPRASITRQPAGNITKIEKLRNP
jgi:RHS repeat-associated protein